MARFTPNFIRRQERIRFNLRRKASGKPRLSVFRSNNHIYAQIVDDSNGKTLFSASSLDKELKDKLKTGGNKDSAKAVGELIAKRAKAGYIYHGRVKALADAAREAGLKF
jgi:large subunit ribosomal protein L18